MRAATLMGGAVAALVLLLVVAWSALTSDAGQRAAQRKLADLGVVAAWSGLQVAPWRGVLAVDDVLVQLPPAHSAAGSVAAGPGLRVKIAALRVAVAPRALGTGRLVVEQLHVRGLAVHLPGAAADDDDDLDDAPSPLALSTLWRDLALPVVVDVHDLQVDVDEVVVAAADPAAPDAAQVRGLQLRGSAVGVGQDAPTVRLALHSPPGRATALNITGAAAAAEDDDADDDAAAAAAAAADADDDDDDASSVHSLSLLVQVGLRVDGDRSALTADVQVVEPATVWSTALDVGPLLALDVALTLDPAARRSHLDVRRAAMLADVVDGTLQLSIADGAQPRLLGGEGAVALDRLLALAPPTLLSGRAPGAAIAYRVVPDDAEGDDGAARLEVTATVPTLALQVGPPPPSSTTLAMRATALSVRAELHQQGQGERLHSRLAATVDADDVVIDAPAQWLALRATHLTVGAQLGGAVQSATVAGGVAALRLRGPTAEGTVDDIAIELRADANPAAADGDDAGATARLTVKVPFGAADVSVLQQRFQVARGALTATMPALSTSSTSSTALQAAVTAAAQQLSWQPAAGQRLSVDHLDVVGDVVVGADGALDLKASAPATGFVYVTDGVRAAVEAVTVSATTVGVLFPVAHPLAPVGDVTLGATLDRVDVALASQRLRWDSVGLSAEAQLKGLKGLSMAASMPMSALRIEAPNVTAALAPGALLVTVTDLLLDPAHLGRSKGAVTLATTAIARVDDDVDDDVDNDGDVAAPPPPPLWPLRLSADGALGEGKAVVSVDVGLAQLGPISAFIPPDVVARHELKLVDSAASLRATVALTGLAGALRVVSDATARVDHVDVVVNGHALRAPYVSAVVHHTLDHDGGHHTATARVTAADPGVEVERVGHDVVVDMAGDLRVPTLSGELRVSAAAGEVAVLLGALQLRPPSESSSPSPSSPSSSPSPAASGEVAQGGRVVTHELQLGLQHLDAVAALVPLGLRDAAALDLRQLSVGLTSSGQTSGFDDDTGAIAGAWPRRLSGAHTLRVRLANLRSSPHKTLLEVPEATLSAQLGLRDGAMEGQVLLEVPQGTLAIDAQEYLLTDLDQRVHITSTGPIVDGQVQLTLDGAVGRLEQNLYRPYPVEDATVTGHIHFEGTSSIVIDDLIIANPRGGTRLLLEKRLGSADGRKKIDDVDRERDDDSDRDGDDDLAAGAGQRLMMTGRLDQDLARLDRDQEVFVGSGTISAPVQVDSGDLELFRVRAAVELNDVAVALPAAGVALRHAKGSMQVREAFELSDAGLSLVPQTERNTFARVRFQDVQPFLSADNHVTVDELTWKDMVFGPIHGSLQVEGNVFAVHKLRVEKGPGVITGQLLVDYLPGAESIAFRGNATGLLAAGSDEPLNANAAFVLHPTKLEVDGRMQIVKISRTHMLDFLNMLDPYQEDASLNQLRRTMALSYPKSVRMSFSQGLMSMKADLGGLGELFEVGEIRGLAVGPFITRHIAPLMGPTEGPQEEP